MKDVIISIKNFEQTDRGLEEVVEFVTEGQYEYSQEKALIAYEEVEFTSSGGCFTTYTVENDTIMMTRVGVVNMQMLFQEGKRHYFVHETPYGKISMGVDTSGIVNRLNYDGGYLEIRCTVEFINYAVYSNVYKINIKEKKDDN